MERVIVYVDGMNLYYGLRAKYGHRYLWLDVSAVARLHLLPAQELAGISYFTARVRNQPASERRQRDYLDALDAHCHGIRIVEGRFQERIEICRACGAQRTTYDEKETDVNIATSLVRDSACNEFDVALVVSADADLVPAVRAARAAAPAARFVAAFPPRRRSDALRQAVDAVFTLGEAKIRAAQLPEVIRLPSGRVVRRPDYWRGA